MEGGGGCKCLQVRDGARPAGARQAGLGRPLWRRAGSRRTTASALAIPGEPREGDAAASPDVRAQRGAGSRQEHKQVWGVPAGPCGSAGFQANSPPCRRGSSLGVKPRGTEAAGGGCPRCSPKPHLLPRPSILGLCTVGPQVQETNRVFPESCLSLARLPPGWWPKERPLTSLSLPVRLERRQRALGETRQGLWSDSSAGTPLLRPPSAQTPPQKAKRDGGLREKAEVVRRQRGTAFVAEEQRARRPEGARRAGHTAGCGEEGVWRVPLRQQGASAQRPETRPLLLETLRHLPPHVEPQIPPHPEPGLRALAPRPPSFPWGVGSDLTSSGELPPMRVFGSPGT